MGLVPAARRPGARAHLQLHNDRRSWSKLHLCAGINSAGELVGNYYSDGSPNRYGFTDVNGTFTTLSDPASAINTDPTGINDAGKIVGTYYDSNSVAHGFLYQNNGYTTIDDPAAVHGTVVDGINNAGEIVGTYFDNNFGSHGFIDSGGHFVTIDAPGTTSGYSVRRHQQPGPDRRLQQWRWQ